MDVTQHRWPRWSQWRALPSLLSPRERYIFLSALVLIVFSSLSWFIIDRITNYANAPTRGGSYTEALIGQPRFINPILSEANDVDRDLTSLVYAGLMKYDGEGNIVPDMAEQYEISQDGLSYTFILKEKLFWHDGEPIDTDDVVFTVNTAQNPDYNSPLRINWQNARVEKIDERTVKFILNQPYAPFLETLTIGILPEHIWSGISVRNFSLAEPNLTPIGSGPYQFKKFTKDSTGFIRTLELESYQRYHLGEPYITNIAFYFYETENEAIVAWNRNEVMGIGSFSLQNEKFLRRKNSVLLHRIAIPRFFAIFFNQSQHKALADKNVRLALRLATDKREIIKKAGTSGKIIASPFVESERGQSALYNLTQAKEILDNAQWIDKNSDGIREKQLDRNEDPIRLTFTLTFPRTQELQIVAQELQQQWKLLGIELLLQMQDPATIHANAIKPRNYEMILFGEVLGVIPDLYIFWHSSQKRDPGVNLALYDNKDVDTLLEEARTQTNDEQREKLFERIEEAIINDAPAVFLYNPYYIYPVEKSVQGITTSFIPSPSKRFSTIHQWYIKTTQIRK